MSSATFCCTNKRAKIPQRQTGNRQHPMLQIGNTTLFHPALHCTALHCTALHCGRRPRTRARMDEECAPTTLAAFHEPRMPWMTLRVKWSASVCPAVSKPLDTCAWWCVSSCTVAYGHAHSHAVTHTHFNPHIQQANPWTSCRHTHHQHSPGHELQSQRERRRGSCLRRSWGGRRTATWTGQQAAAHEARPAINR